MEHVCDDCSLACILAQSLSDSRDILTEFNEVNQGLIMLNHQLFHYSVYVKFYVQDTDLI